MFIICVSFAVVKVVGIFVFCESDILCLTDIERSFFLRGSS